MWARNRSAKSGCSWSMRIISRFGMRNAVVGRTAVAVLMRTGWPARHPSPRKSPGPRMATTASLPVADNTESFTLPSWRWKTEFAGPPWANTVAAEAKRTARPTHQRRPGACAHQRQATGCRGVAASWPCDASSYRVQATVARNSPQFSRAQSVGSPGADLLPERAIWIAQMWPRGTFAHRWGISLPLTIGAVRPFAAFRVCRAGTPLAPPRAQGSSVTARRRVASCA